MSSDLLWLTTSGGVGFVTIDAVSDVLPSSMVEQALLNFRRGEDVVHHVQPWNLCWSLREVIIGGALYHEASTLQGTVRIYDVARAKPCARTVAAGNEEWMEWSKQLGAIQQLAERLYTLSSRGAT